MSKSSSVPATSSSSSKKFGSNWKKLQGKIVSTSNSSKEKKVEKRNISTISSSSTAMVDAVQSVSFSSLSSSKTNRLEEKMRKLVVGLDCEMVGVGISGKQSCLARCSIVDFDGNVVYDSFVQPKGYVTDFRTKYSGVRKSDIRKDQAASLEECQKAVSDILKDKVLVGHALKNDFNVLFLSHPRLKIRDTSTFKPYMKIRNKYGKVRPRALRDLSLEFLGKKIQDGEHDSVEDAKTAVMLYRLKMEEWESSIVEMRKGVKKPVDDQQINAAKPTADKPQSCDINDPTATSKKRKIEHENDKDQNSNKVNISSGNRKRSRS